MADAIRSILGKPGEVNGLIRILRDQAEQIQGGAVVHLQALIEQSRDINRKLENATEAVLNGLASQTIKDRIRDLETQKTNVERELRTLKAKVDASAIPEQRIREILHTITNTYDSDPEVLFSIVYRVEVGKDCITIWTILDADPNGTIDHSQSGVTITSGDPSGVPNKTNPNFLSVGEGFGFVVFFKLGLEK